MAPILRRDFRQFSKQHNGARARAASLAVSEIRGYISGFIFTSLLSDGAQLPQATVLLGWQRVLGGSDQDLVCASYHPFMKEDWQAR